MAAKIRFAAGDCLALQLLRQWLLDADVRRDALALDRFTRRRVVESSRQAQRAVFAQRNDGLNRALTKGLGADNGCPAMILQRASNDFRRARRTAIDENDDRLTVHQITRLRGEAGDVACFTAARGNNLSAIEE